ncbi:hypothetical protein D3C73_1559740 [compost metagenome]
MPVDGGGVHVEFLSQPADRQPFAEFLAGNPQDGVNDGGWVQARAAVRRLCLLHHQLSAFHAIPFPVIPG